MTRPNLFLIIILRIIFLIILTIIFLIILTIIFLIILTIMHSGNEFFLLLIIEI